MSPAAPAAPEDDAGRGTRYVVEHQPDLERGCDWLVVDMQPPGYPGERHVVAKCYRESVARRIALILAREFAGPEGSATPPLLAAPSGTASVAASPPFMLPTPTEPTCRDSATRAREIVRVVPRRENTTDATYNVYVGTVYIGTMVRESAEDLAARINTVFAAALTEQNAMSAPGGTPQGDSVPMGPREARLREALTRYPFGGLDGLLREVEGALRARGAHCASPESCGPLGCLLAKIHHARKTVRAALASPSPDEGTQ